MCFARRSALASIMRRAHKAARRMLAHFATYRAALSYALRCVYRAAQAKAYLHANAARVLVARFVKADRSVRRMRFVYTLGRPETDGTVTVWDYDKSATRQINLDTLAKIAPALERNERPPVARAAEPAEPRPVAVLESLPMEDLTLEELDVLSENWFG